MDNKYGKTEEFKKMLNDRLSDWKRRRKTYAFSNLSLGVIKIHQTVRGIFSSYFHCCLYV